MIRTTIIDMKKLISVVLLLSVSLVASAQMYGRVQPDSVYLVTLNDYILSRHLHPTVNVNREKGKPVVFITGDSTVKNEDCDENSKWGWGSVASTFFDMNKVTIVNCAIPGRSCRSFLNEGRWTQVCNSVKKGDYVIIDFGHNDASALDEGRERGAIMTSADTSHVYRLKSNGYYERVYSFGDYLRRFIADVRAHGGIPILVSVTPRNIWVNGKIQRDSETFGCWFSDVAAQTGVEYVDLRNLSADVMDKLGMQRTSAFFCPDNTHTTLAGAKNNARCFAEGLRQIHSSLANYLKH